MRCTLVPTVEHRSDRQRDRRNVYRRRRHQARRRRLVAAGREHDPVERIAVQHLDQAEIRKIAIEACSRTLTGFLNRMNRKLDRDAACFANAFAHALGQHEMMTIARRQIAAGLRDADDRFARLQLFERQTEIHVALEIQRSHVGVRRVVEPRARAQWLRSSMKNLWGCHKSRSQILLKPGMARAICNTPTITSSPPARRVPTPPLAHALPRALLLADKARRRPRCRTHPPPANWQGFSHSFRPPPTPCSRLVIRH